MRTTKTLIRGIGVGIGGGGGVLWKIRVKLWGGGNADAQADLSLRWAHSHFVGFVMRWLIYHSNQSLNAVGAAVHFRGKNQSILAYVGLIIFRTYLWVLDLSRSWNASPTIFLQKDPLVPPKGSVGSSERIEWRVFFQKGAVLDTHCASCTAETLAVISVSGSWHLG